ncbi:MAG TPA: mycothiol synthase [Nocardioides sp.]|uniref:mycothiol synthase n=1 Tax=Nocardioides sp. TaxID=35761 RepID=UPI002F416417
MVDSVVAASARVDGAEPIDEAARMSLAHRGVDGNAVWVADDGFALLHGHDLDVAVAPEARGHGTGRALVEAALHHAPPEVTAWSHADHPAAARLAASFGFSPVRALWVMSRGAGPVDVPQVDGVTIRGYRDSDADEVLRVNAAAFAHHPEQGSMDAANLAERMAEPWFDPEGLLVADAGEGLVAFHWTKVHDAEHGEVYVVAVDPAAQGRGLGRTITAAGLAHLASVGVRRIILYVESDNEPAIATYSGLGFEHASTHVQYAREGSARLSV